MAGTPLSVGVFDGTPSPADGTTFVLTAIMEENAKYVINYYKVNVDANGDPLMSQAARLKQDAGFAPVGVGINIKDGTFNELLEKLMQKPVEEMQELYNHREIEK